MVGYTWPTLVPAALFGKRTPVVVAVYPAKLLEGCCCSEAFATVGSYWDYAFTFLFGPYLWRCPLPSLAFSTFACCPAGDWLIEAFWPQSGLTFPTDSCSLLTDSMSVSYFWNYLVIWLLRLKKAARKWLRTSGVRKLFLAVLLVGFTGSTTTNMSWFTEGNG